jgi:S-adenosylmethionine hydrolase
MASRKRPIITLLTDFGTKDHYVASMKGVILSINPRCTLIDITHHVKPHAIEEGAFILASAYSSFPKGTIHLSVVDPGVGSLRKPVLLVTENYFFVGPDNGLFTFATWDEKVKQAICLTNRRFFIRRVSTTFHGRDVFAPVAAHLSLGTLPKVFGREIKSWVKLPIQGPRMEKGVLSGEILHIDVFGNLISNIREGELIYFAKKRPVVVRAGKVSIRGMKKGYWEGKRGEVMALIGSGGFLEVSVREGNAGKVLKLKKGDPIIVDCGLRLPVGRQGM